MNEMTMEEEQEKVYAAIGKAVSAWGAVEITLALLFSLALTRTYANTNAMTIFFTIENFRSKMQVLDALMLTNLPKGHPLHSKWLRIANQIHKRAKKRNRLAHHDIMTDERGPIGRRVKVIPPFLNPINQIRMQEEVEKPLYLVDIQTAISEITQARLDVLALTKELVGDNSAKPATSH